MNNPFPLLLEKIYRGGFVRNVAMLASGTLLAQIINFLVTPVLTRLYTPEDFGLLAIFMAIASPISNIASLRYDVAIMLPDDDSGDAEGLLALAVFLAVCTGFLFLSLFYFLGEPLAKTFDLTELGNWLLFVPISVTVFGVYESLRVWSLRRKRFTLITASALTETGSRSLIQIVCGLLKQFSGIGLIAGQLLGQIFSMALLAGDLILKDRKHLFLAFMNPRFNSKRETMSGEVNVIEAGTKPGEGKIEFSKTAQLGKKGAALTRMAGLAKRYKDFPLYQGVGKLLNSFSREWMVLLIGAFFGLKTVGLYYMGLRVLNIPLFLVGKAIGDVFFEKGAREKDMGNFKIVMIKLIQTLCLASIPMFTFLIIIAPSAFSWIFGPEWREAGIYLRFLTPLFAFRFAIGTLNSLFSVFEKQKTDLIWQIAFLVTTLSSAVVGGLLDSIHASLLLYSLSGGVMYVIMLFLFMKYSDTRFSEFVNFSWMYSK